MLLFCMLLKVLKIIKKIIMEVCKTLKLHNFFIGTLNYVHVYCNILSHKFKFQFCYDISLKLLINFYHVVMLFQLHFLASPRKLHLNKYLFWHEIRCWNIKEIFWNLFFIWECWRWKKKLFISRTLFQGYLFKINIR